MSKQFNDIYGTDVGAIDSWRKLCQVLGIFPIPESLEACRNAVVDTHVNLVDLVDTPTTGKAVVLYKSEEALSKYTIKTGKTFSRKSAHAGGLLKFLLRRIFNPRLDEEGKRSEKGRRHDPSRGRGRA